MNGNLTHYVIVRRDLPLGVAMAQATHAAGESFCAWAWVNPKGGYTEIERTKAVVLGSRNMHRLESLAAYLSSVDIPHVTIREPDAPWNNELMAIGLHPGDGAKLAPLLTEFHMLNYLDKYVPK